MREKAFCLCGFEWRSDRMSAVIKADPTHIDCCSPESDKRTTMPRKPQTIDSTQTLKLTHRLFAHLQLISIFNKSFDAPTPKVAGFIK
jgi:hypothetical protein